MISLATLADLGVRVEHHGVARPPLGAAAQVTHVAEHLQRTRALTTRALPLVHRLDGSAPGVQVADDVAHVVLGGDDLDAISGSSRAGLALRAASLKAIEPAILKAISEESTSWYCTSRSDAALTPTMG